MKSEGKLKRKQGRRRVGIVQAARELGVHRNHLLEVCKGNRQSKRLEKVARERGWM